MQLHDYEYKTSFHPDILRAYEDADVRFLAATNASITITLERAPPAGNTSAPPGPHYLLQGAALSSFLNEQLSAFEHKEQYSDDYVIKKLYAAGLFYQKPIPTPSPSEGENTNTANDNKAKESSPRSSQSSKTTPPRCDA